MSKTSPVQNAPSATPEVTQTSADVQQKRELNLFLNAGIQIQACAMLDKLSPPLLTHALKSPH